jgi:hypothetical protein
MFPNMGVPCVSTLTYYDIKKLYRFFDKEGVYLNIESYNPRQWIYNISLDNGVTFGPGQFSRYTREDAEIEGFAECFKLLDRKIRELV